MNEFDQLVLTSLRSAQLSIMRAAVRCASEVRKAFDNADQARREAERYKREHERIVREMETR